MEAWIVADPEALAGYYGKHFNGKCLPSRRNPEEVAKEELYEKLQRATERTQKGAYAEIKHASRLLERVRPEVVGARCPRFRTFTSWLTAQVDRTMPDRESPRPKGPTPREDRRSP